MATIESALLSAQVREEKLDRPIDLKELGPEQSTMYRFPYTIRKTGTHGSLGKAQKHINRSNCASIMVFLNKKDSEFYIKLHVFLVKLGYRSLISSYALFSKSLGSGRVKNYTTWPILFL